MAVRPERKAGGLRGSECGLRQQMRASSRQSYAEDRQETGTLHYELVHVCELPQCTAPVGCGSIRRTLTADRDNSIVSGVSLYF